MFFYSKGKLCNRTYFPVTTPVMSGWIIQVLYFIYIFDQIFDSLRLYKMIVLSPLLEKQPK